MATPKKTPEQLKITYGNVNQKRGRPSTYTDAAPDTVRNYITECKNNDTFPTVAGLSLYMDTTKETLNQWSNKYPEFADAIRGLHAYQEQTLVSNTLNKQYSDRFAQFFAVNCLGYSNKQEITASVGISTLEDALKNANGDKF